MHSARRRLGMRGSLLIDRFYCLLTASFVRKVNMGGKKSCIRSSDGVELVCLYRCLWLMHWEDAVQTNCTQTAEKALDEKFQHSLVDEFDSAFSKVTYLSLLVQPALWSILDTIGYFRASCLTDSSLPAQIVSPLPTTSSKHVSRISSSLA